VNIYFTERSKPNIGRNPKISRSAATPGNMNATNMGLQEHSEDRNASNNKYGRNSRGNNEIKDYSNSRDVSNIRDCINSRDASKCKDSSN